MRRRPTEIMGEGSEERQGKSSDALMKGKTKESCGKHENEACKTNSARR